MIEKLLVRCVHSHKVFLFKGGAVLARTGNLLVRFPFDVVTITVVIKAAAQIKLLQLTARHATTSDAVGFSKRALITTHEATAKLGWALDISERTSADFGFTKSFEEHVLRLHHQVKTKVIHAHTGLAASLLDPKRSDTDGVPPTEVKC